MGFFKSLSKAVTIPVKTLAIPEKVVNNFMDGKKRSKGLTEEIVDEIVDAIYTVAEEMDED